MRDYLHKLFLFVAVASLCSCGNTPEQASTKKMIARAGEDVLYEEDLAGVVPYGTAPSDSIALLRQFIDNWVRRMLVIRKAESNLTDELKNVERQLEDYRNSLITYAYEKELVRQKLDTVVTEEEIAKYYAEHEADFQLRDNIVKVVYIKVSKKAPQLEKLRKLYRSEDKKDRDQLETYCRQFAANFFLDDTAWLLFDDLLKEIPIQSTNKELFLQSNKQVEVSDSLYHYFLNIKGYKIRNSNSPLAFERENIKNIILNKRKLLLINGMKEDVYNTALNNKEIEIRLKEN